MKHRTALLLILILAAGTGLRLLLLDSSLEYDEIWSLSNYAVKSFAHIFSNLATPNNHPLNSLGIKVMLPFFESCHWSIRLFPFLCGVLSILLVRQLGKMLFRSKTVGLAAAAALAFNPWTIEYSALARGYSIQIFLILLFSIFLLKARKNPLWYIGTAVSGILSVLTLAPSALFLIPICGFEFLRIIRKKDRKLLIFSFISFAVLGGFVLLWFLIHRADFQHGQMFGTNVRSPKLFFDFVTSTLMELVGFPTLLFLLGAGALCVLDWRRKMFAALFTVIFFPLLMALCFKAGPMRVYLPLIPFIAIADAGLLVYLSPRKYVRSLAPAGMILLTGACWITHAPVDKVNWLEVTKQIHATPDYAYFVIPACDALPAYWNGRRYAADFSKKLLSFGMDPQKSSLITLNRAGIEGLNKEGYEDTITIPKKPVIFDFAGLTAFRWKVLPLSQHNLLQSRIVLLRFAEVRSHETRQIFNYLSQLKGVRKLLLVNQWYSVYMKRQDNGSHLFLFAMQIDPGATSAGELFEQVLKIRRLTGVYTLSSVYSKE